MIESLKTLTEITPADRPRVGGKAYNCARLWQAGFPVPDGLVIPIDATEAEIRGLPRDTWLTTLAADTRFAVRSSGIGEDSAGHSFAGIHETQLNVRRDEVVEAVLLCRRSAQSPQAIAYRASRGLADDAAAIGVLVEIMVAAVVSGVAFTINPTTGADEIVINAAHGLGEALVSGQVDPDEFIVRKSDRSLLSSRSGADQQTPTLSADQLQELTMMLVRIEEHYASPQDVEWCHDGRQFWVVQSRPVTTGRQPATSNPQPISDQQPATSDQQPTRGQQPATVDIEWTRANLAEVFPDQMSPQVLASYERLLNEGQRVFLGKILAPESELGPMFKVFRGRMYLNLSQMRRVPRFMNAPAADMLRSLGHSEGIRPEDEIAHRAPLREILPVLPDFVRIASYDLRMEKVFREHQHNVDATIARLTSADPQTLSDREIWDTIAWWTSHGNEVIKPVLVMSGMLARETALRKACETVGIAYEAFVYPQLAAGERSVSSQQAIDLVALAGVARHDAAAMAYLLGDDGTFVSFRTALAGTTFLAALDEFLERYGHRGTYESDWALPRLYENPAPILFAVREQLKSAPQDIRALTERQQADAAAAWRAFESRLRWWQRLTLLPRVRATLRQLKQQYVWREQVRFDLTRILRYVRPYHLALADRFVERGWIARRDDYFLLRFDEITPAIDDPAKGSGLQAIAERRQRELAEDGQIDMPLHAHESELARLAEARSSDASQPSAFARPAANARAAADKPATSSQQPTSDQQPATSDQLPGQCVSPGVVEAEVVVMRDPTEFRTMRRGAILVAPATDPSWTPLFTLASGVIVEVGGMLSHASTIAREYGLPALANVKRATRVLQTGDRVRLDASGGRVTVLEHASSRKAHVSSLSES